MQLNVQLKYWNKILHNFNVFLVRVKPRCNEVLNKTPCYIEPRYIENLDITIFFVSPWDSIYQGATVLHPKLLGKCYSQGLILLGYFSRMKILCTRQHTEMTRDLFEIGNKF